MRISELARTAGLPLATVKHYLRVGLLPAGRPTAANQARYDQTHVKRLRLVRALTEVGGLSLAATASVLAAVDAGPDQIPLAAARAHEALGEGTPHREGRPDRALAVIADLDWLIDPRSVAVRQLEAALGALDDVGHAPPHDHLAVCARAALSVAEAEMTHLPAVGGDGAGGDVVAFVVMGTVLYEPVLLALRRLAQQHVFMSLGLRPNWPCDDDDADADPDADVALDPPSRAPLSGPAEP